MSTISKGVVTRFDRELDRCARDLALLRAEIGALESYRATLVQGREDLLLHAAVPKSNRTGGTVSSRAQCIEEVLVASSRPMSIKEICKACEHRGLPPNKRSTYATLSMLHARGIAAPTERGVWAATTKLVAVSA